MCLRPLALACAALLLPVIAPAAIHTEAPDRITSAIVPSARVKTNAVPALATPQADAGRIDGSQVFPRMVLLLKGSDQQQADLKQLLADQQDATSPQYHKWLTPTEFGERFGPSSNDLAAVSGWLSTQGFTVEKPSAGRRFLLFTGTSGQVESAFQTEMHRYTLNGKTFISNGKPASIPAAIASVVQGVSHLDSFAKGAPQIAAVQHKVQYLSSDKFLLVGPSDLSAIYNATPLKTAGLQGEGQTIALIEESNIDPQDVADFRTLSGLPPAKLNIIVNGPDPGPVAGEETEAIADTLYAGAFTPNANIDVIVTASTPFNVGVELSTIYAVDYRVANITSLSYGVCETLANTQGIGSLLNAAYEQGAAEGISHFVSSGDNGGDTCYRQFPNAGYGVNGWGSSPYNVSVGGTEFIDPTPLAYFPPPNYLATGYIPERAWNDYPEFSSLGILFPLAGTGGVSSIFTKPYWQSGPGVPSDGQRDVPDVSLLAGDRQPYYICQRDAGDDCSKKFVGGVIGTSLSSPAWASIQALVNQKAAVVNGAGNPNPTYYALAAGKNSPFHDITVGDNKIPDANGQLIGYTTTPGYDLATGLGSVDINALANSWTAPTGSGTSTVTLTTSATHITHGSPLTATVTVKPASAAATPTGDVVLFADNQGFRLFPLSAGTTSYPFGPTSGYNLPGGTYNLTAHYAGDALFATANSNPVSLIVDAEPTTTTEAPPIQEVPYGAAVALSAAATGTNSGTGVVAGGVYTFSEAGKTIGTATIAQTGESFATPFLSANLVLSGAQLLNAGTHQIVATYAGDKSFLASTSAPVTVKVDQGQVLVSLAADHTAPYKGTPVNLSANVTSLSGNALVPISGSIQFFDGGIHGTLIATAVLPVKADSNGSFFVTVPYTSTTAGPHALIAVYTGSTNFFANFSGAVNVTIGGQSSTTTTITGTAFALAGTPAKIQARILGDSAGALPSGTVTFVDTNVATPVVVGTAPVDATGLATLTITTLPAGRHNITANYAGDANYTASLSTAAVVRIGDFAITAAAPAATVVAGQISAPVTVAYSGNYDFTYFGLAPETTFSCSGLPTGTACSFYPNPLIPTPGASPLGATTGSVAVTIATTGPTLTKANLNHPEIGQPQTGKRNAGLLAMAGLFALGLPFALRRRRTLPTLFCLLMLAATVAIAGCGTGYNGPQRYTATGGTPAGVSAVTVTATVGSGAATLSHTTTINLTVTPAAGQ